MSRIASPDLAQRAVNTIKGLTIDAVQKANSGHPGMPMGMADATFVLWHSHLKHDPSDPTWPDRDRFVLSAGHGSMLLYSLLHLTGYDLSLDDLKAFRQWGSRTPGHPEVGHTPGVETTTGPLGQGFAMGVGMAFAERWLRERFGAELVDHWTYGVVSDGDLMEGVAAEAASLAGHLRLGRIVYLYDDNEITIDGSTSLSFTEDRAARFTALGWHVQTVDGHDRDAVNTAILAARQDDRPSLICCRTRIGKGSPNKEGSEKSHGSPLGAEEIRLTKIGMGMDPDASFVVPEDVVAELRAENAARISRRAEWEARLAAHPRRAEWAALHETPDLSAVVWPSWPLGGKGVATRKANQDVINAVVAQMKNLVGGSADLAGSNGTTQKGTGTIQANAWDNRNVSFGVREHAMAAMCNGMTLHGGIRPYNATFLVFHDYMRPAVRLSSLMHQPVVYIYTHDSFHLGEDGPTHQPIEHLMAMRLIPGLVNLRPADATEVTEAWKIALGRTDGPTTLSLTRQELPVLDRSVYASAEGVAKGAYVLAEAPGGAPQVVIMASGSEVDLALKAQPVLAERGVAARVVSFPSWELFEAQPKAYRDAVLPPGVKRLSVEAGRTFGWERYVGQDGRAIGIDHFGASAPAEVLAERFGFTVDAVVDAALTLVR
jgi:transketolase